MEYKKNSKKSLEKHLRFLSKIEREKHHPIIHEIHKEENISEQTLFYVKEYGAHSNVSKTIIKESVKILILASIISSLGGFALESIKVIFLSITPLILLLPALNNTVGNFGTIISSRFSTMLHEEKVKNKLWKTPGLKQLFLQASILAFLGAILSSFIAITITYFSSGEFSFGIATKVFIIAVINMVFITNILFFVTIFSGIYIYRKKEDPNNFLIPLTTSIADLSNMALLSFLIILFF